MPTKLLLHILKKEKKNPLETLKKKTKTQMMNSPVFAK